MSKEVEGEVVAGCFVLGCAGFVMVLIAAVVVVVLWAIVHLVNRF